MHPEDQQLVEIARQLCDQLNFKANPQTINWMDRWGWKRFPTDRVLFFRRGLFAGSIQLPKAAMGKLSPEEWRPLLASGISYYKNINTGMLRATLPMYAIFLLEPLIIVANFRFLGEAQFAPLRYLTIGLVFVLLGVGFLLTLRGMKSLFFKADQRAAQLVGNQSLVNSLTKLASIDPSISSNRKGLIKPSINERISHLTKSTT